MNVLIQKLLAKCSLSLLAQVVQGVVYLFQHLNYEKLKAQGLILMTDFEKTTADFQQTANDLIVLVKELQSQLAKK